MSRLIHIFGLLLFTVSLTAFAEADFDAAKSAHRDLNISGTEYRARVQAMTAFPHPGPTPMDRAVAFGQSHLPQATVWESQDAMIERFEKFRDERFIEDNSHPEFPRRSTWLYPDDGCHARAALAIKNLMAMGAPAPKKIFVFGTLKATTPNTPSGLVGWWFHVAPVVEVSGVKWVLDPALEPRAPLKLEDWLARMSSSPAELEVAICEAGTYTPIDLCARPSDGQEVMAIHDQQGFLLPEWRRLLQLGRNPDQELGDSPPWKYQKN